MEPEKALANIPRRPGVYIYRDGKGQVLYVGKAQNLRQRVRSYFQPSRQLEGKTMRMLEQVRDVEWITTQTEIEAFLLEESLIKEHRPKYNVLLRDDKHYPFLKLTHERYPKLVIARRRDDDKARYFGPFPSGGAVKETLRLMQSLFPLRSCSDRKFRTVTRPCLLYHIRRCSAPCVGWIDEEAYRRIADEAVAFLSGRREDVRRALEERMQAAAEALHFEEAAELRDRIRAIDQVLAQQTVVLPEVVDLDAVGLARDAEHAVVEVFQVRRGQVVGRVRYLFQVPGEEGDDEILKRALAHHFRSQPVPPAVITEAAVADHRTLAALLSEQRGKPVRLTAPRRGPKRDLLRLVRENAREGLREVLQALRGQAEAVLALQQALGLPRPPRRIEGYDISNTQGAHAVAAMVVFEDGRPKKAHYRRFHIRSVTGPNDFRSLEEAVTRRFARQAEGEDPSFREWPDLLLIDGGRGQLSSVRKALEALGLPEVVPTVALAKRFEELYVPNVLTPILLPKDHPGLRLLQAVRDEAHRFANRAHGQRREAELRRSRLDEIEGIGPKRKRLLLEHFGSVKALREAEVEAIVRLGIPKAVAERLKEEL